MLFWRAATAETNIINQVLIIPCFCSLLQQMSTPWRIYNHPYLTSGTRCQVCARRQEKSGHVVLVSVSVLLPVPERSRHILYSNAYLCTTHSLPSLLSTSKSRSTWDNPLLAPTRGYQRVCLTRYFSAYCTHFQCLPNGVSLHERWLEYLLSEMHYRFRGKGVAIDIPLRYCSVYL